MNVKQYIFHRACLKRERERVRQDGDKQGSIDFLKTASESPYRGRTGRKEMVPDWLEKRPQPERQETGASQSASNFEEEKAKLMEELRNTKNEGFVRHSSAINKNILNKTMF